MGGRGLKFVVGIKNGWLAVGNEQQRVEMGDRGLKRAVGGEIGSRGLRLVAGVGNARLGLKTSGGGGSGLKRAGGVGNGR